LRWWAPARQGVAAATTAARRGHQVTLFEADPVIGGQFNYAKRIPGKEEFAETLRYYNRQIELLDIDLRLNTRADADTLEEEAFDEVVLATGGKTAHPQRLMALIIRRFWATWTCFAITSRLASPWRFWARAALALTWGEFLTHDFKRHPEGEQMPVADWQKEWGVDPTWESPGALTEPHPEPSPRQVYLLQRKTSKPGKGLGKTTGWVHRVALRNRNVEMIPGVTYKKIDDEGLHIQVQTEQGSEDRVLEVDNVVICTGQLSFRDLADELTERGMVTHLIGGAEVATELDAKRAFRQGTEVAAAL
jgi:Uncharacterized NAD(FAD)-dependent dehydrogenases